MIRPLLLALLFSAHLLAAGIDWYFVYDEALEDAKAQNKKILVFMTQPGCGTCNFMKENVFSQSEIKSYIDAHFIPLELTVYHKDIPEHLRARVTPVFHFLDSSGKSLHPKLIGGKTASAFLKLLQEANGK